MPERMNRFPRGIFVGAVVVITGGAVAVFGLPDVLANEEKPRVVTVPDIPEIMRQATWVHEQRAQERSRFAEAEASLEGEGAPTGPIAVEGAPPEPAPASAQQPEAAPADPVGEAPAPNAATESTGTLTATADTETGNDAAGLAVEGSAPKPVAPVPQEPVPGSDDRGTEAAGDDSTKTSSAAAPSGLEPPYDLEIRATARQVWIWISVDDGPQQAVSLDRGESAQFQARERYVLTVDDAGGVEASLNGKELPSFGGKAQAKRDLVIPSPESEPVG